MNTPTAIPSLLCAQARPLARESQRLPGPVRTSINRLAHARGLAYEQREHERLVALARELLAVGESAISAIQRIEANLQAR